MLTHNNKTFNGIEALESRTLLSGMTLIADGYSASGANGPWVGRMGVMVESTAGVADLDSASYLINVDGSAAGDSLQKLFSGSSFSTGTNRAEAIMLLNWADASNNFEQGGTTVTATTVANLIADRFLTAQTASVIEHPLAELPIHLIGFGRGAAVMTELARILGTHGIWVDQITLLDPHPLVVGDPFVTSGEEDPALALTSNVIFADNYFRSGGPNTLLNPNGQSVLGAANIDLSSVSPTMSHDDVHVYYHGTGDLNAANDGAGGTIQSSWYSGGSTGPRNAVGYQWSRLLHGDRTVALAAPGLLTSFGGTATGRAAVTASGGQWPNISDLRLSGGMTSLVSGVGGTLNFRFSDLDSSATVTFYLDVDDNPYNNNWREIGSSTMASTAFANGSQTISTAGFAPGTYRIGAKVTDGANTRYTYMTAPLTIAAPASTGDFRLYFPEGFRSDPNLGTPTINEYVPLVNPNPDPVTYTIFAHYEVGSPAIVQIAQDTIPAFSRGGITTTEAIDQAHALVRAGVGYSIEVRSTGAIGAMLSHYDFGVATGEAFRGDLATSWYFPNVSKGSNILDFLTFLVPGATDATVTVNIIPSSGSNTSVTINTEAGRRGGLSFHDVTQAPTGTFALFVDSTQPIIASLTHYETNTGQGYLALGENSTASETGSAPFVDLVSTSTYFMDLFNRNDSGVVVNLSVNDENGTSTPQTITLTAGEHKRLTRVNLGLLDGHKGDIVYTSSRPIVVATSVNDNSRGDALGTASATRGALQWLFADGYMANATAGTQHIESITVANPGATSVIATITFYFLDGTTGSTNRTIAPGKSATILLHQEASILSFAQAHGGQTWFGSSVSAASPITASMIHWDLLQQGGWETLGTPVGTLTLL